MGFAGLRSSLLLRAFEDATGARLQQVPFRGTAPMLEAVLAGHVLGAFTTYPAGLDLASSGKLKVIALSSKPSLDALPNVPTFGQQGFSHLEMESWTAIFAPKGTQNELVGKLNAAFTVVLKDSSMRERLGRLGIVFPTARGAFASAVNQSCGSTTCGKNTCPKECNDKCNSDYCCATMYPRPGD